MILGFGSDAVRQLAIEPLDLSHTRPMADIHAQTFSRPWTDGEFVELLSNPASSGYALREPLAKGGRLVGFVVTRTAGDEVEVLTIAVRPNWQGYGCGRLLMDRILADAHRDRLQSVFLEVNEHNSAAIALYKKLGFTRVGARPDYYRSGDGSRAAALVMRRDIAK